MYTQLSSSVWLAQLAPLIDGGRFTLPFQYGCPQRLNFCLQTYSDDKLYEQVYFKCIWPLQNSREANVFMQSQLIWFATWFKCHLQLLKWIEPKEKTSGSGDKKNRNGIAKDVGSVGS